MKKRWSESSSNHFSVFSEIRFFFRSQIWKLQTILHKSYGFYFLLIRNNEVVWILRLGGGRSPDFPQVIIHGNPYFNPLRFGLFQREEALILRNPSDWIDSLKEARPRILSFKKNAHCFLRSKILFFKSLKKQF